MYTHFRTLSKFFHLNYYSKITLENIYTIYCQLWFPRFNIEGETKVLKKKQKGRHFHNENFSLPFPVRRWSCQFILARELNSQAGNEATLPLFFEDTVCFYGSGRLTPTLHNSWNSGELRNSKRRKQPVAYSDTFVTKIFSVVFF